MVSGFALRIIRFHGLQINPRLAAYSVMSYGVGCGVARGFVDVRTRGRLRSVSLSKFS